MYAPSIIAEREAALFRDPQTGMRARFPRGLPQYALADCRALTAQIVTSRDPETDEPVRLLSQEEEDFIAYARWRVAYDAPFYLETFVWIDEEGHGIRPLYPLWESQVFVLQRLAALELQHDQSGDLDGLLVNILKARQLGVSTLAEALLSHRVLTQRYIRAIAGSDVEEQAKYLFRMVERIYEQLPFFLQPSRLSYNTGREIHFSNQSSVKTAWGKTTRGALQETGGQKGNIERGRSQPLEEPILTPYGWRSMGAIAVGDRVIGSTGEPTKVLGTYLQGIEPVYRVTFSDGAWTECSGDHLWQVTTAYKTWAGLRSFVRTTLDLLDGGLYWEKPSGRMAKWFVPVVAPVQFAPRTHTIPPYTLGAYLGDGSTRTGALQLAARDPEIKARVAAELPADLKLGDREYDYCWYIRRRSAKTPHRYLSTLQALGLREKYSHEKFIPESYLHAPIVDRIALLQGLMDTDGTASRSEGKVNFSTTSAALARDFRSLVEGLGGIARVSLRPPQKPHTRKNGQRIEGRHASYVFSVCLPPGICPFHLPRKIAQLVPLADRKYFPKRAIVAIDRVGEKATQCLKVEAPDQLYVTRHYVVTHNTNSVVHISELATWDYPEQLDAALLPGIPISPKSLVLFESTAELAGDWWHRHWLASEEGQGRFRNLFIPWCVEPAKYATIAPALWAPNDETLKVAAAIERDSHLWVGRTLRLTRAQLYWYETTRAYYAKKNQLFQFFKEFPSNPEECFMYAGRSIFSHEELERIDQAARPLLDVWAVEPSREIAELRRLPAEGSAEIVSLQAQLQADALKTDRRPAAPIAPRLTRAEAEQHPVPPGFGFRRLGQPELATLPSLRASVLAIYEYPRARGPRRYVMAIDVGDGLGQDYSVITVVRLPTLEEVAEEVAQYVSNSIRPAQIAFVADAIGRLYSDSDGIEALAAPEINNHGVTVQDMLQMHLGYTNFYVWEVVDAADPASRFTRRIGWQTTTRTRPILLEKFHDAVTTIDPISGLADFRLNSSITRAELRHFVTGGLLGEAEHARGQHDDAIFSAAIAYIVAFKQAGGEIEPIADRRRRRETLKQIAQTTGHTADYRNSGMTSEEADAHQGTESEYTDLADEDLGGPGGLYFDDRSRA